MSKELKSVTLYRGGVEETPGGIPKDDAHYFLFKGERCMFSLEGGESLPVRVDGMVMDEMPVYGEDLGNKKVFVEPIPKRKRKKALKALAELDFVQEALKREGRDELRPEDVDFEPEYSG